MATRKIFNYESVMLNELTEEIEGYHPDKYGPASAKFIWARCRFCGKPSRIRKGFFNKAGSACHKECRFKEQSLAGSPFKDEAVKQKARETNLKRYGAEHACQNKEIAKRISSSRSTQENKDKIKSTNMKKYGVENPFQSEEIKKKIKKTNLTKYGHEHAMQSDEIKEKTKQTNRERYGVDNPMKSKEVQEQAVQTNLDKYGVANPMQNPSIKAISQKRFLDVVKLDPTGHYKLINILRGQPFWERMKQCDVTLKELCNEFNIDYQSTTSRLLHDEFRERYYEHYSFPRQQQQKRIKKLIESYGITVIFNDRKTIAPLELDLFMPSQNFAIEFNGNYWHSEIRLGDMAQKKHRHKTDLCRDKGIRLFHIFEHQWGQRQTQLLNFIRTIVGANEKRIAARKCTVANNDSRQFLDDNHIQGYGVRTIRFFNLIFDNEIVASMTASKHHRQNGQEGAIVLNRLCFKDNTTVQGGASKLFKRMVVWAREEGYTKIVSWSDNCWTEGDIYRVLGFDLVREYGPDYFYWDLKKHKHYSKQSQQKKKTGCPEGMTEREWCIERGLSRIWDCGKRLWSYEL